ncbi:RNA 3'-terminal phosphate cyclase/enolpyruvate transferase, alpha/beta [Pseudocohnilembus persalinus]|uniref:RNA 3'-terminal phosphate cyclase/enolpyruvate transferase, alpha/beta n=1 Tax=Pseudocohnilembus persalinus TaxID=266149 RepID=A0A0V0R2J7_PSEPJ|nr:RNA 3'-terminal phosphate cyclase/enolpyruvate transferase, alpha/beta [Pseudocohnilembus persalinus]|eukprot:KRX08748.1 RNA 3'-terminal phosphate cyclase/enolpyruvate transferase, alpha/beta [Pseudocohnilembus persalinus]
MNDIIIDGSLYEGGGQIIRNSMALSNILQTPFQIINIRSGRPNPGLNNQLTSAITLLKQITDAQVSLVKNGIQKLEYQPLKKIKSGQYHGGAKSAAAISLMFQSLVPTMIFGQSKSVLLLSGGTDVNKSPPSLSVNLILRKLLEQMGVNFVYQINKEGYYPYGGGVLELQIENIKGYLKPIKLLNRNPPTKINITFYLTNRLIKVNEQTKQIKKEIKKILKNYFDQECELDIQVEIKYITSKKFPECYAIILNAVGEETFIDASYHPQNPQNEMLDHCTEQVIKNFEKQIIHGGCLDEHHQDQLLIYMALAQGTSQIRCGKEMTPHTQAVFYVLKKFIPNLKYLIEQDKNDKMQSNIISIEGIGLKNE